MTEPRAGDVSRATGSQAIERALAILGCFSMQTPTVSMSEFIARTGLTMPTTHRIIRALERRNFVVRDPHTNRYSVGGAIVELAQIPLHEATSGDLVPIAVPYLDRLRAITNETAGLHVHIGDQRMCVAELVSNEPIRMASGVGQIRELGLGAAGKVIAAYLTPDRTQVKAGSPQYGVSPKEIDEIRRLGYATSFGETVHGASAIAAPVLGPGGAVLGAVNVTGPEARWSRQRIAELANQIVDQVVQLSARLGAPQPGPLEQAAVDADH